MRIWVNGKFHEVHCSPNGRCASKDCENLAAVVVSYQSFLKHTSLGIGTCSYHGNKLLKIDPTFWIQIGTL